MLKNRFFSIFALVGLAGLIACNGGDAEVAEEGVVTDTIIQADTALAPVVAPVVETDTAAVVTETDVDVDVETDTVPVP